MPAGPPPTSACLWDATAGDERGDQWRDRAGNARADVPAEVDVAIVGGGYTGLWTALSLAELDPRLRVAVLERERVGFGASGRNGGWCSALLPVGIDELARSHGRDSAIAMQRAMFDTVEVVGEFAARDGARSPRSTAAQAEALYHRGGTVTLARTPRQAASLAAQVDTMRAFGFGDDDLRLLDTAEAARCCNASDTVGAAYTPHCAAIHPRRLVDAIAAAAESAGVTVVEGVEVTSIERGAVATTAGRVRAAVAVLATEAYTTALAGRRRDLLPVYSLMIASEPLDDAVWDEIGLADRPTFADARRTVIYGQRTADGRLAFGGRGAPYHFGSRIEPSFDRDANVRRHLHETIVELFPSLSGVEFPYHWGGPLGVPRDWHPHVRFDRAAGIASAGGYAGDGVATANLAGRTLADLICGRDTELTRLPWVGHRSRRWEPEPLRWLGVRLAARAARRADDADFAGRRSAATWDRLYQLLT